jgi:hypothetical protein
LARRAAEELLSKEKSEMSDTSQHKARLGVAGVSAALLLALAACGEPATEGEQQQGSVAPTDQSVASDQATSDTATQPTNTQ